MNLILLFPDDFVESGIVMLRDRRMAHLKKVHRAKPGDALNVGLLNGQMGSAIITAMKPKGIEMQVLLNQKPPEPLPLSLILALPRPKMLKRILQSISSLGVKEIFLLNTWRVEKSFWSSPLLQKEKLEAELILGLEQAKDTILPHIHLKRLFMPFITEELPKIISNKQPRLLTAHPGGVHPCPGKVMHQTILAMGPEGGFIEAEINSLEQAGFMTVHLGSRILRLETAVPYIISKLF